jgi:hypothetical protein
MTRACLLLSHGHAVRATMMHPAVWLWAVLLARDIYRRYVALGASDGAVTMVRQPNQAEHDGVAE